MRERYDHEQQVILRQIELETLATDPVYQRVNFVTFISCSAGKGRGRRPREIQLLVVDGQAFQVAEGAVKSRADNRTPIDVLAMEILTDVPKEQERDVELLLKRARQIANLEV